MKPTSSKGIQTHVHIPSDNPVISEQDAREAEAILLAIARNPDGSREEQNALNAARSIVSLYQTQERYSKERLAEMAKMPKASANIRELAKLTPDEVAEKRRQMAAGFPGA